MSTRASIVYTAGLHIYKEVVSDDICISYEPELYARENTQYGDQVITEAELKEIMVELQKYFGVK